MHGAGGGENQRAVAIGAVAVEQERLALLGEILEGLREVDLGGLRRVAGFGRRKLGPPPGTG